eukprot:CAMPEP_0184751934 /NCGR_PEP_ID=MMETSP0315-20130426/43310_1 /TAXON_ID=101924 /ORGANISM="Rhodosorus marinus, Strain UTEX LB 2760" /LENGTH=800 /DNA_ID=CAMNT_0027231237 /DNA_START=177 /DNA_END=2580 /DNA_ORIENTATION=-
MGYWKIGVGCFLLGMLLEVTAVERRVPYSEIDIPANAAGEGLLFGRIVRLDRFDESVLVTNAIPSNPSGDFPVFTYIYKLDPTGQSQPTNIFTLSGWGACVDVYNGMMATTGTGSEVRFYSVQSDGATLEQTFDTGDVLPAGRFGFNCALGPDVFVLTSFDSTTLETVDYFLFRGSDGDWTCRGGEGSCVSTNLSGRFDLDQRLKFDTDGSLLQVVSETNPQEIIVYSISQTGQIATPIFNAVGTGGGGEAVSAGDIANKTLAYNRQYLVDYTTSTTGPRFQRNETNYIRVSSVPPEWVFYVQGDVISNVDQPLDIRVVAFNETSGRFNNEYLIATNNSGPAGFSDTIRDADMAAANVIAIGSPSTGAVDKGDGQTVYIYLLETPTPVPTPTPSSTPTSGPATPTPTDGPATPTPTEGPATPTPTDGPATPTGFSDTIRDADMAAANVIAIGSPSTGAVDKGDGQTVYIYLLETPTPVPTTTPSSTPTSGPATPTPTSGPATPTPTDGPATPTPTDAPATPTPTDAPATPTPTNAPATPTPTDAPATPTPTDAPATPTPTDAPATPTPTDAPATPTPTPTDAPATPTASPSSPTPTPTPTAEPVCFSAESEVKVVRGNLVEKIALREVRAGDLVEAFSATGELLFSETVLVQHANSEAATELLEVSYEGANAKTGTLKVTGNHLVLEELNPRRFVKAQSLKVGGELLIVGDDWREPSRARITSIDKTNGPVRNVLTMNNMVVVDGVLASSFTAVLNIPTRIQAALLAPFKVLHLLGLNAVADYLDKAVHSFVFGTLLRRN